MTDNLRNLYDIILQTASENPFIEETHEKNIYEVANEGHSTFPLFCCEVESATNNENTITYNFQFCVSDLHRTEGQVQQWALQKDILSDIVTQIEGATLKTLTYYVQKFSELCVLTIANVEIEVSKEICYEKES